MDVDDEEEREHWWNVLRTFLFYSEFVETEVERRQKHIGRLQTRHYDRLPQVTFDKLAQVLQKAEVNQAFFEDMSNEGSDELILPLKDVGPLIGMAQHHRNNAVLHSLYREWSVAGAEERAQSFGALVSELRGRLPVVEGGGFRHRVLVPGCGLGRLPLDVAASGYCCEGNEFSAYMAVASNFILNGVTSEESYEIFPWISNICNIVKVQDSLQSVRVPDITASKLLRDFFLPSTDTTAEDFVPRFSMAAGDFTEIYAGPEHRGQWDCVLTCFFIDTAPNVLKYIETIEQVLKPGGLWINLGPLLYHWVADVEHNQDERYDQSIELSYEEVKMVIEGYGFVFLTERQQACTYTRCPSSMMHTVYDAMLFTVQKPLARKKSSSV